MGLFELLRPIKFQMVDAIIFSTECFEVENLNFLKFNLLVLLNSKGINIGVYFQYRLIVQYCMNPD